MPPLQIQSPTPASQPHKPSLSRPAYDLITFGIPPSSLLLSAHEALLILQTDIDSLKDQIFEAEQEVKSQGRTSRIMAHRLQGKEAREKLEAANRNEKRMRELERRLDGLGRERGELQGDIEWFEEAVAREEAEAEAEAETTKDLTPKGLKIKTEE